jgi:hypothetical protein
MLLLVASANRDERRYPDGDRFDIHRQGPPHITFGRGIHACLGSALARVEGRVALDELLKRFPNWTVDLDNAKLREQLKDEDPEVREQRPLGRCQQVVQEEEEEQRKQEEDKRRKREEEDKNEEPQAKYPKLYPSAPPLSPQRPEELYPSYDPCDSTSSTCRKTFDPHSNCSGTPSS